MGLKEAITELEGVDPQEFADALQNEASPFYKAIRNPAFKEGKDEAEQDAENARNKVAQLRKEKQNLENQMEELKGDLEGDDSKLAEQRGKYESKLQEMKEALNQKDKELKSAREESMQTLRQKEQQFFQERAKNALLPHVKDPDIADVKLQKAMQDGRVKFDDDLNVKVYEEDGEVPTPINGDKAPHEVFAESILENIKPEFLKDNRPGSTGFGDPASGSSQKMRRDQFDQMSAPEQKAFVQDGGKVVD